MPNRFSNSRMERPRQSRAGQSFRIPVVAALFALALLPLAHGQQDAPATPAPEPPPSVSSELDRVIAVVNNQVILASDLDLEIRLVLLLPTTDKQDAEPVRALERLTTRALIEQQILLEDPHGMDVAATELESGIKDLRQNLPACRERDCTSPAGWAAYLRTLHLTPEIVATYWSDRIAILRFIEMRFRSGIRITPEEIQKYYTETLLPQYVIPADAPTLEKVSSRIQEVLLQQQVNALLNDWLKSLQDQGQVEVLDPTLRAPVPITPATDGAPQADKSPAVPTSLPKGGRS